jgi:heterodisulfide reductase subunit C
MILLGMIEEVLESDEIWLCSSCYTCQEVCPQGIRITDLITAVRNMAFKEGHLPQGVGLQDRLICSEGRLYALDEFDQKKREKANLPLLLSTIGEAVKLLEDRK